MDAGHIDRGVARSRFARLARSFPHRRDPVSEEVALRHLDVLEGVEVPQGMALDLGSGLSGPLPDRLAGKGCVRLDWVAWGGGCGPDLVADIASLPLADCSFTLVWSNLGLPWVGDLPGAMAEARRVLSDGGLFAFAAFGPDTLVELRRELGSPTPRTLGSFDMHDLADMAMRAGFAEPVAVRESFELAYPDRRAMAAELRTFGALAATGMAQGLGSGSALRRFTSVPGPFSVTFEVTYIHAWALAQRAPRGPAGWQELRFDRGGDRK